MSSSSLDASFVVVPGNDGPLEGHNERGSASSSSDTSPSPDAATLRFDTRAANDSKSRQYSAHDWSRNATGGIRTSGRHFVDKHGRVCWLRGVNLSGSCKTPSIDDHSTFPEGHKLVTFVDRPFPLTEAHEHLARLRRWGLSFVRLLVTWEAIEHEGPGIYDKSYFAYLHALLSLFSDYGLVAFLCMHQDVWSRYCGGSGAPAWTLEVAGFDLSALENTGAAWLKGVRGQELSANERGLWPTGYTKLAAATMATLFWGGEIFAPKLEIEGQNIQSYLQEKFLDAWSALVKSVGNLDSVIGFEMMNEPHFGYIGHLSLHEFDYNTHLHLGDIPSALQSFALGAGHPTRVPHWTRTYPWPSKLSRHDIVNGEGRSVWRSDSPSKGQCVWEMHGVWGWDKRKKEAVVLRENYFLKNPLTNEKVEWYTDCYFPFIQRWSAVVRASSHPDKVVFTEVLPNEFCPVSWTVDRRPENMVYAPHWYDLIALFRKEFGNLTINVQSVTSGNFILKAFHWGQRGAKDNYSSQLRNIVESSYKTLGETPTIIGECGVPMDLNKHEAFTTGNWTFHARMMDALISGLERSLIGFTLWNYNAFNDNTHGDYWNGENFSLFSRDSSTRGSRELKELNVKQGNEDLDDGGRVLRAIVRPYPAKTAGVPTKFEYDLNTGIFSFEWTIPSLTTSGVAPSTSIDPPTYNLDHSLSSDNTEIFFPSMLARGRKVIVQGDGETYLHRYDEETQTLSVIPENSAPGTRHKITVSLSPPLKPLFALNDFWTDFGTWVSVVSCVLVTTLALWLAA